MLIFALNSCVSDINITTNAIKGNGTLVTNEISIEDYDQIKIAGSMELNYQQLDENPYLQLIIDENLVEFLDIYVKNRTLYIEPAKNNAGVRSYSISPTKFTINTNSTQIKSIDRVGSGTINLLSDIHSDKLELDLAGSGTVFFAKTINVGTLEMDLAGSGKVLCEGNLQVNVLDVDLSGSGKVSLQGKIQTCNVDVAGSGTVSMKGNAETCKVNIAGSGSMKSPDFSVKNLRCDVAGSGKVQIDVSESLQCDIAGSGTVVYTGNPSSLKQSITGSGKLVKK
jgi:hypothetical protein